MLPRHGIEARVEKAPTKHHGDQQTGANLLGGMWTRSERTAQRPEKNHNRETTEKTPKVETRKAAQKGEATSVDCSRHCPMRETNRAASHMSRRDSDEFTRADASALRSININSGRPLTDRQMDALSHLKKHAMEDDGTGEPLWKKYAPKDAEGRSWFKDEMFGGNADYQDEKRNSFRYDTSASVQLQHRENLANYGESLNSGPHGLPMGSIDFSAPIYH